MRWCAGFGLQIQTRARSSAYVDAMTRWLRKLRIAGDAMF
jgi:hypothetical protein